MVSVRRVGLLIVAGGVAAIVAAVLGVAFYPQDPLSGVSFTADRSDYSIGQVAVFSLFNGGETTFRFEQWTVQRLIDDEWRSVECHLFPTVIMDLRPDERMTWSWHVIDANPGNCLRPAVEAGPYRGFVTLGEFDDFLIEHVLFAEFEVV